MNKMKEVAELLGVQLGEKFKIKNYKNNFYYLEDDGLKNSGLLCNATLTRLLNGEYEIKKQILDKVEKKYLENVLRPFKNKVTCIKKVGELWGDDVERILVYLERLNHYEIFSLPWFKKGTMYNGMEIDKKYSLEELGLFENE